MTDGPRPVFDVVHSGAPRRGDSPVHRVRRQVGIPVLAALLSAPVTPPGGKAAMSGSGGARMSREVTQAGQIAEAERGRDAWSRLGDLLNDVVRNSHQDHPDRTRDAREPSPQHMVAPVPNNAPPLNRRARGR
jgi:hypothetical protein